MHTDKSKWAFPNESASRLWIAKAQILISSLTHTNTRRAHTRDNCALFIKIILMRAPAHAIYTYISKHSAQNRKAMFVFTRAPLFCQWICVRQLLIYLYLRLLLLSCVCAEWMNPFHLPISPRNQQWRYSNVDVD